MLYTLVALAITVAWFALFLALIRNSYITIKQTAGQIQKFQESTKLAIRTLCFIGLSIGMLLFLFGTSWLPNSVEWPVGYTDNVLQTDTGYYIVPHTNVGRVQIYDENWNFIQGWSVNKGPTAFVLELVPNKNLIQVHLIRRRHPTYHLYDMEGNFISESDETAVSWPENTPLPSKSISTHMTPAVWQLPFIHPIALILISSVLVMALSGPLEFTFKIRGKTVWRSQSD